MISKKDYDRNVFINCAFDANFVHLFRAITFTVHNCGFIVRCALEAKNSQGIRIDRILKIIEQCRYGIHDISCVELTEDSPLPRFNMPYELGIFMGCKSYGAGMHKKKEFLVLDAEPHRYKRLISDLSGYDFPPHANSVNTTIEVVSDWLSQVAMTQVPGHEYHQERYTRFVEDLPLMCENIHCTLQTLKFHDYYALVSLWIQSENEKLLEEE